MQILHTLRTSFKDKASLSAAFQQSILIDNYTNTQEQQALINQKLKENYILCYKDSGNNFLVLDIDDGETFENHCNFKDELFESCKFVVNKGKDSKGFDKWHLYFKYDKDFTQSIGIKGLDILCGSPRLLFSHPSLNNIKLQNYSHGEFKAEIVKGSSPFDAIKLPSPLKSKLLKFLDRKETSNKIFVETKIQSISTRNAQYKTCDIDLYRQFVSKIKKAKNSDGSYDEDKLLRGISLNESINNIVFEGLDKGFKNSFNFTRIHEPEDGSGRRNDFVCNHLLTKLLFDPSVPKDYYIEGSAKINGDSEFLNIIFTISQSPFVHFDASREGEIIAALKSRIKNNKAFEIFYDENWESTSANIYEISQKDISAFYLEVLEKYKDELYGFVPLKTLNTKGTYDFWLYDTSKKPNMIGKKYAEDKNPKLVSLATLNEKFNKKFDKLSIPLVEFTFNMDRPERFFYEKPSDRPELLETNTEITDELDDLNKVLKFNTFNETKYMHLFRTLDRQRLQNENVKCPRVVDELVTHLVKMSFSATHENYTSLIQKAKNFIYKSLAYKLEYKKQGNLAWFFKGVGGSGKTLFTGSLLKAIFGQYHTIVRMEDVTNRFNSAFEDKLFIVVDETDKSAPSLLRAMKQIVANKSLMIERKGKDTYEAINRASLIVNTNFNSNLMEKLAIDRREVEFSTSLDKLEFNPYFAELKEQKNGSLDRVINEILLSETTLTNFIRFLKSLPMDDETEVFVNTQIVTDAAKENIETPTDAYSALASMLLNKDRALSKEVIETTISQIECDADESELVCRNELDEVLEQMREERLIRENGKLVVNETILKAILPKGLHPYIRGLTKRLKSENLAKGAREFIKHFISEKMALMLKGKPEPPKIGVVRETGVVLKHQREPKNLVLIGFSESEFQKYVTDINERRKLVV